MTKTTGYIAAGCAAIFFGSNFIPLKKYDMGDGMYFQMIMSIGIWVLGLIYEIIRNGLTAQFHPFALIGGIIWATGNLMTVAIIKTIGMALGLAIWGSVSLCTGWLTGKYGLLGTPKDDTITRPTLNFIGLIIVIIAIVLFAIVKPNNENNNNNMEGDGYESMIKTKTMVFNENYNHKPSSPAVFNKRQEQLSHINDPVKAMDYKMEMEMIESWVDKLSPKQKQIAGVLISSFAGFCYGVSFCPIQYLMSQNSNNDEFGQDLEDYSFEHFCGIVTAGVLYFTLYIIYTKNKPSINISGVAPSILSGFLWGFGQIAFFVATDKENLGTQTAFPVIVTVPQIVASSWGVFYFKEVSGFKEISKLLIALIVLFTGIGFMVIAKY